MAIRTDQYTNSLTVVDTVTANSPLNLIPQGTAAVNIPGTGQNLVTYSEQFQQAAWYKNLCTITADTDTAPNGTLTADTLTTSSIGDVYLEQTGTAKGPLCYSFYVKQGGASPSADVTLRMITVATAVGDTSIAFTFSTKTFSGQTSVPTSYGYVDVGNGWFRIYATMAASAGQTGGGLRIRTANVAGNTVLIWGAQLEVSGYVGPYIQTVASVVYGTPSLQLAGLAGIGLQSDGSVYVQPAGTGGLQAQATTSTATGGNARGANAVDFQTTRSVNSMVASGQVSFIGGGQNNTSSSYGTVVCGGANSYATGTNTFVGSGNANVASGPYSSVISGSSNSATGYFNFIGSGISNSGTALAAVTTQSATMNGTTAVTLSGSNANIKVGQYITGTSIAFNTYVAAISGTSLTLSQAASGSSTSTLSFFTPHGVVVGGGNNQATGAYSFIGAGGDAGTAANRNSVVSDWGVVVGGFKNTIPATGIANTIGGGYGNTISSNTHGSVIAGGGTYNGGSNPNTITNSAAVISGGINNSNSSFVGFIGGGFNNTASGSDYATIVNGQGNTANSSYSFISGGYGGTTRGLIGYHVFPASNAPVSTTQGVQQAALLVLGVQTTDATATVLRSNPSAAGTTNQVILPNNSAYFFTGEVVAGVTGGGNTKGWTIEGVIKRGANAAATALVGTPTVTSTYADAGASTWVIAVTADTTNGGLAVTFTGQLATTIRVVCQVRTTEMTF